MDNIIIDSNIELKLQKQEQFQTLRKTPKQGKFINALAELISSRTPYNVFALRGFILRSCKQWQIKNQKYFYSLVGLSSEECFKSWIDLSSIIFTELTRRAIRGEAEWELGSVLSNAFTLYAQFCINK